MEQEEVALLSTSFETHTLSLAVREQTERLQAASLDAMRVDFGSRQRDTRTYAITIVSLALPAPLIELLEFTIGAFDASQRRAHRLALTPVEQEGDGDDRLATQAHTFGEWSDEQIRLYDARRAAEGLFQARQREEERERERRWAYEANWYNRECGERWAAARDQHYRIRQLKDQHRRSLQPHFTSASRCAGKENRQCQQPRGSRAHYNQRNKMSFNNASVYRPKAQRKKTQ